MSDVSQGPGWWQASDGKWYAPQQAAGATPDPAAGAPVGGPAAGGPAAAATGPGGAPLAEFGPRAIGLILDWAFGLAAFIVLWIIAIILGQISSVLFFLFYLLIVALELGYWLYLGYMVGNHGQTAGMKMQGIKCLAIDTGQPVGVGMGIVRGLVHGILGLFCVIPGIIDYLFPLWDVQKQTLADKSVKTEVIAGLPQQKFSTDLFKP